MDMTAASRQHQRRHRSDPWQSTNSSGIYYRPEPIADQRRSSREHFPAPLIGPRRARPHAIHVVTFPPGYIPRELRSDAKPRTRSRKGRGGRSPAAANLEPSAAIPSSTRSTISADHSRPGSSTTASASGGGGSSHRNSRSYKLGKFISSISGRSLSKVESLHPSPIPTTTINNTAAAATGVPPPPPAYDDVLQESSAAVQTQTRTQAWSQSSQSQSVNSEPAPHSTRPPHHHHPSAVDMAAVGSVNLPSFAYNVSGQRNSLMSVRSAKSAVSSLVTEVPKPVASGSGVSCSILLAERNVFLHGFDHDGHVARDGHSGTALLRGRLRLDVTKNVKIKAVQLKLMGRARTEWPEGIPPLKQELSQEESLRTQVLTFFNVMHDGWESEYGNQCTYKLKSGSENSSSTNLTVLPPHQRQRQRPVSLLPTASSGNGLTAKQLKRLSLQSSQSRSYGKGENGVASTAQAKGYRVFYPGTYDYTFELPIDHHQLETTRLQYGSVKWELHASVERAGAFKPNLHGIKEVSIVRLPDQMSLETTEPISISRQWEDQLHYDIVISGKSFPIGSKIPIAFKLTPLAKVQVHKIKVYVTESIEYWTSDKRVTRKDQGRKILLLEKSAGKPLDPNWATSEVNTLHGGEPSPEQRRQAREIANLWRTRDAARHGRSAEPLPEPTNNLLGDLDLGLEHMWGATEMEANVQLPTCQMMAKNKDMRLHPDCSWKNVNVYHWIKIVLRISRIDPEDPTGTKRRHFEISIDSPFTVLNCRATQANTNLPAYSSPTSQPARFQSTCGCSDSATFAADGSPNSSSGTLPGVDMGNDALPLPPQAAHLAHASPNPVTETSSSPSRSMGNPGGQGDPRPIHLLRVPSFQPPAFDEDTAPPPAPVLVADTPEAAVASLMTPPPQYDVVIGTPSVDGLADYFTRLADYGYMNEHDNNSGSDSDEQPPRILDRSGRVNVRNPRTPGGRMPSRSLEITRPSINPNLPANLPHRPGQAPAGI